MSKNMYNDSYNDFYAVMEQTSPIDNKIEIISEQNVNGLSFLRFSTCLQTFGNRNRNGRLWQGNHVRVMSEDRTVQELIAKHSFVGENGHPVPDSGKISIERILSIDPNNCSHRILSLDWKGTNEVHGTIETLDEGVGSPGYRFMRNILQGIIPAFSLRSVVPQRKNNDGTIDVLGPGRMVCYDRVYLPSHEGAYMDMDIAVKNIIEKPQFEVVMESYCDFITSHSDKIRSIVDNMEPAMESASIDTKTGLVSVPVDGGRIFIAPETKYRKEIRDLLNKF